MEARRGEAMAILRMTPQRPRGRHRGRKCRDLGEPGSSHVVSCRTAASDHVEGGFADLGHSIGHGDCSPECKAGQKEYRVGLSPGPTEISTDHQGVVTYVDAGSQGDDASVKVGWAVQAVNG